MVYNLSCLSHPTRLALLPMLCLLSSCATVGSIMAPYAEDFSCKNSDHGQCIDPHGAYADAVNGRPARSDPAHMREPGRRMRDARGDLTPQGSTDRKQNDRAASAFSTYRDSVYRELQGLIDAPVTPMLKAPRTVRTLILPYADRQRPERLYMPRYVYSVLDAPSWVVGDYLVDPVSQGSTKPVLEQVRETSGDEDAAPSAPELRP